MKEIRTIKMVEQTEVKFVADDGKEFETEKECRDYERTNDRKKVEEAFSRVDFKEIKLPFLEWLGDDYHFYKITLNERRDYVSAIDYFEIAWNKDEVIFEEPKTYPHTTFLFETYYYVDEYSNDIKEELCKAIEQL